MVLLGLLFTVRVGVMVYLTWQERREKLSEALVQMRDTAAHVAREQRQITAFTPHFLTMVLETQDLRAFATSPRCKALLAGLLKKEPRLANLTISDPQGNWVCNPAAPDKVVNVADRDYFPKALATREIVAGSAVVSRSTGKFGLPYAKAIRNQAGEVEGVLAALLDLAWVNRELSLTHLPEGARIGLIDHRGLVLARDPDPEAWVGRSAAETPFFKALQAQQGEGTFEAPGFDGVHRMYGFARFADTVSGPIYLWVGVSRGQVLARANRGFVWTMATSLAVLSLFFGLLWLGSDRLIFQPLEQMAGTAKRLGGGDHTARTGLPHGTDEMGVLAKAFDEMAFALVSKSEFLRLNRALRVLSQCNKALVQAVSEEQLLSDVCRILVDVGGYHLAWVGFAEPDHTVRTAACVGPSHSYLEHARISWGDDALGLGPTGTAIRTATPQINQDFSTDPKMAPWRETALAHGLRSSAALPLKDRGQVLGVLSIYAGEPVAYSAEEIRLLEELAADLAFGIGNLRLREASAASAAQMQQAMEATIQAMAATVEMRDPYTAGHQRRVASLAVALARRLGRPPEDLDGIRLAGLVHDLGKIRVPAEILTKPTRLSEVEFQLIKLHPETGYDVLKGIAFPWPIAEMVRQHHERLDGSGYPRGLQGGQILPGARILAVADIVEALASHRPYRPAMGIEVALEEIRHYRGIYYDTEVVDACVALFLKEGYTLGE